MALALDPRANQILAALPDNEQRRWMRELEPIELPPGAELYGPGKPTAHVYFPTTAIVSLLYPVGGGASAQLAVIGCEGVAGVALIMGDESTPDRAVVQSAGHGFRLQGQTLLVKPGRASLLHLILRYTRALVTQMAQVAACNRQHSPEQQLCRWLLLSLDRLHGNELSMTQELIAAMLGLRRQTVAECALMLQGAGLIRYAPGRITVLDRAGLSRRACGCYAVVKQEYDRLLPAPTEDDPAQTACESK